MPTEEVSSLRETIRIALAPPGGRHADAKAIAEATAATWDRVTLQLAPVIGARGLDTLFGRALHVTSAAFPWLAVGVHRESGAGPLPRLAACLERQDAATAAEGSYALLVTFTELLATLIGESLTLRLLAPVWAVPSLPSGRNPPHE